MKPPVMKTPALATVYLDNASVGLMGDPHPLVSKIVVAGGKHPGSVQVLRTQSATDQKGKPVRMDDVIDRTAEPTRPIYLRSRPNATAVDATGPLAAAGSVYIEFPSPEDAGPRPLGSRPPGGAERDTAGPVPPRRGAGDDPEWLF